MTPQIVIQDLVLHLLAAIDRDPSIAPEFPRLTNPREIWRRLVFCILSSRVKASVARLAAKRIVENTPTFRRPISAVDMYNLAQSVLKQSDLHYRFPETRAKQVAASWAVLKDMNGNFYAHLDNFDSEYSARAYAISSFSGLGLKQASMFLRDIGFSDRLCVIDAHIHWYCSRLYASALGPLTAARYLELERTLLEWSDVLGVTPNVLDSTIWVAVRALKERQCMMQFA